MTWRETYEKWLNSPALSEEEWKELDAIRDDPKEIEDRFYAPLVFGTAGLRGIMGLGTNRMNIHVIRHATQAFAELIVAEGTEAMKRGVCVCHDCRNNGVAFAREAAAIMAAIEPGVKEHDTPYAAIVDRRQAIYYGLDQAGADDVVVIAGRGPETHQILRDGPIPLVDKEIMEDWCRINRREIL